MLGQTYGTDSYLLGVCTIGLTPICYGFLPNIPQTKLKLTWRSGRPSYEGIAKLCLIAVATSNTKTGDIFGVEYIKHISR